MKLKFVGKNGSKGLVNGEIYDVLVNYIGDYIWVLALRVDKHRIIVPYESPKALAEDWEGI